MPEYAGRTPFVGRERERALLLERLKAAGDGQGGVVLVAGEPGIGKTRLLEELADGARAAGWTVIGGRAYETEGLPPYLPFIEAVSEWANACTDDNLRSCLGGSAAEVALLVPEVDGGAGGTLPAGGTGCRSGEGAGRGSPRRGGRGGGLRLGGCHRPPARRAGAVGTPGADG